MVLQVGTDLEMGKAPGDGSALEDKAHCFWGNREDLILKGVDPFLYVSLVRLESILNDSLDSLWFKAEK